jgi:3-methyladenine DNA glycosylase AlkD
LDLDGQGSVLNRALATRSWGWFLGAMVDAAKIARRMEAELKEAGTPERAAGEKRYLKSDFAFLGSTLGDMRRVAKSFAKNEQLGHDDLIALVQELWSKPVFERRMVAVILLELHAPELGPNDLPVIEGLIRESRTWALVDALAGDVVSEMAVRHRLKQKLDRWAKDNDFWIRRSSLLAELKPLKMGSPFQPFAVRADAMLDETEFFIRKAIGWVLREMSKKRPGEVYEWIAPRTHRASGVTMREAVKYLEAKKAARLMRAYKEGRPTT